MAKPTEAGKDALAAAIADLDALATHAGIFGGIERQRIETLRRQAEILLNRAPAVVVAEIAALVAELQPFIEKCRVASDRWQADRDRAAAASIAARDRMHDQNAAKVEAIRARKAAQQEAQAAAINARLAVDEVL
jgi:hypothetical protein